MRKVLSGLLIPYLFSISCAAETKEKEEATISDEVLQAKAKELADTLVSLAENISNAFPDKYTNVQRVADHIDYVVKFTGIDHVELGSDFDGAGDSLPEGLKDVAQYPNLIYELLKSGYADEDIEKIGYKNVFRVWDAVEQVAKGQQSSGT